MKIYSSKFLVQVLVFIFFVPISIFAQNENHSHKAQRFIEFPNIPGYLTLKTDLHIHSVFSDGSVWPTIRVQEALRDGLDAISLTEHIEYQPHKADIPHPDRNRSYEIALNEAKNHKLLILNGAEVTREMPPGHVNAVFIKDANELKKDDPLVAFKEAKKQGGFIFWNHPNWVAQNPNGVAVLTDMHKQLIKNGLLHGIEVVNEHTYSDEAFQIAIDNNLTIMGTSDVHGLIDWDFNIDKGGHRPVTLVFAKEKTVESLKEGLFNRRTVVWYDNTLIGNEAFLKPLVISSLEVEKVTSVSSHKGASLVKAVHIKNNSDVDYILQNVSEFSLHSNTDIITLKAHSSHSFEVKTLQEMATFNLKFKVLNAISKPKEHLEIEFNIKDKP